MHKIRSYKHEHESRFVDYLTPDRTMHAPMPPWMREVFGEHFDNFTGFVIADCISCKTIRVYKYHPGAYHYEAMKLLGGITDKQHTEILKWMADYCPQGVGG